VCTVQLFRLFVVIVVVMIASVCRTHHFKPSLMLSWDFKPVSRPPLHGLPTWSTSERCRLTPLDSLGVWSFDCSVAPIRFNLASMQYFWNGGLKCSIAVIIVAGITVDIPLLANGPTRRVISLHAALASATNERSVVPQSSRASVAHTCSNAVQVPDCQTMQAGLSGNQISSRRANDLSSLFGCDKGTAVHVRGESPSYLFRVAWLW
jgi:hypothetical protein